MKIITLIRRANERAAAAVAASERGEVADGGREGGDAAISAVASFMVHNRMRQPNLVTERAREQRVRLR